MASKKQIKECVNDINQEMISDRLKLYVKEMNKVFDKCSKNKKITREKVLDIMHGTLDRLSINNDIMMLDLLPLTLVNTSLNKMNKKDNQNHASIGYLVYIDGKTHQVHTLLMDGAKNKMDDLFIDGESK